MKICIIGCGQMGSGLAHGLAKSHVLALFDRNQERTQKLAEKLGAAYHADVRGALEGAEIVILAVKPKDLSVIADAIRGHLSSRHLVVSVLAGVLTEKLEKQFPGIPVVRMMPNMAVAYGDGVMGLVENPALPRALHDKAHDAFAKLGFLHWIPENQIDALTALTGSGPAFLFVLMESIADAGVLMGLRSEMAKGLVEELFHSALTLARESQKPLSELVREITSPAGTTVHGLKAMEEHGVRAGIINTFLAAYARAKEMSKE